MNILLTAIGSASAHALHRQFKQNGHRVYGCDIYPQAWNVNAGELDGFVNVPLATDADAYADALASMARTWAIDAIIPLTDVEVDALCTRRERFAEAGATVCCPNESVAALCRDKLRMAKEMADVVTAIPTYTPSELPDTVAFPLMLKPQRGRSSQGQMVVSSRAELESAVGRRDDYIVQPFVTGDIFCVDAARDRFGNVAAVTRRECLRTMNGLGTAVEICPKHVLERVMAAVLEKADVVGAVNGEFIRHGEEYYFLEINPRFSGGVGFSLLAGYDFAEAMLRCYAGEALAPMPQLRALTLAQRYEQYVTGEGKE